MEDRNAILTKVSDIIFYEGDKARYSRFYNHVIDNILNDLIKDDFFRSFFYKTEPASFESQDNVQVYYILLKFAFPCEIKKRNDYAFFVDAYEINISNWLSENRNHVFYEKLHHLSDEDGFIISSELDCFISDMIHQLPLETRQKIGTESFVLSRVDDEVNHFKITLNYQLELFFRMVPVINITKTGDSWYLEPSTNTFTKAFIRKSCANTNLMISVFKLIETLHSNHFIDMNMCIFKGILSSMDFGVKSLYQILVEVLEKAMFYLEVSHEVFPWYYFNNLKSFDKVTLRSMTIKKMKDTIKDLKFQTNVAKIFVPSEDFVRYFM